MRQRAALALGACLLSMVLLVVLSHRIFAAEDCCTPEATEKIAAKAGFVDVVGIKLGMPVKDATAAVKQYNPKMQLYPHPVGKFDLLPNVGFSDGVNARTDNQSEAIELSVAMPPNQEVVWSVVRAITYSGDNRPALANVIAGLRQKYGPEDGSLQNPITAKMNGVEMMDAFWVFDSNGKKAPAKRARDYAQLCQSVDGAGQDAARVLMAQPPRPGEWANGEFQCGEWTLVLASWIPSSAVGQPPGLVVNMRVQEINGLLHRSALQASQAIVQQAVRNRANQEQQKGTQVKPVL